jgi:hypothetical protein
MHLAFLDISSATGKQRKLTCSHRRVLLRRARGISLRVVEWRPMCAIIANYQRAKSWLS